MYFYTNTLNLTRKITKCLTHHCNNLQQLYIFFKYIIIIIYLLSTICQVIMIFFNYGPRGHIFLK